MRHLHLSALAAVAPLALAAATTRPAAAESYGTTIAIADAVPTAMVTGAALSRDGDWLLPAYVVYALTGPVTHLAHDRYGRAGLSLGARLIAPPLGALVGAAAVAALDLDDGPRSPNDHSHVSDATVTGAVVGALVASASAMALDWLVLGDLGDDGGPAARTRPVMLQVGGRFGGP